MNKLLGFYTILLYVFINMVAIVSTQIWLQTIAIILALPINIGIIIYLYYNVGIRILRKFLN